MSETHASENPAKKQGILMAAVAFLLTKASVLLKALKALKYAKFAITAITMSLSAVLYGFAFGSWYFAIGFVLLLLVHEYGHVIAMWRKGIHASAPVFIPFLGAAIFAKIPESKDDEAYIGYGGPLIGTIGAVLCIVIALMMEQGSYWSILLHVLGNVGLFLNLFNLIPARPLDGGRILHPLGGWVPYIGFFMLAGLALALKDLFFVFIALLSVDNMPVRTGVRRMLWGFLIFAWSTEVYTSGHGKLSLVFGTLFLIVAFAIFVSAWNSRRVPLEIIEVEEDPTPISVKLKWFVCYVALLSLIGGTMIWHTQHLPKEVRESPLVRYMHET